MSVALYMDVHVPAPITRALKRRGVEVLTAQEDGTGRLPDNQLLDRANTLGRVLFSRDKDLLREAKTCQTSGRAFAGLIYAHQLRVTIGRCIEDLESSQKCASRRTSVIEWNTSRFDSSLFSVRFLAGRR